MTMFSAIEGVLIAEGHAHDETNLRAGVATALAADRVPAQAQAHAAVARLSETWHSTEGGFGHNCALHADVDRSLWSPHCGTFRPVTIAEDIPAPATVERAQPGGAR